MRALAKLDEGWTTVALLALVVLSAVWSVEAAGWVESIDILPWMALLGIGCGLLFSRLRRPDWLLHACASLLGMAAVLTVVASRLPGRGLLGFPLKLRLLLEIIGEWAGVALAGGMATDNAVFLLLLAVTAWLVGYVGAWVVFRDHGTWWPILCAGCALVVNQSYALGPWWHVALFLVSSLLLIVRVNAFHRERAWRRDGVRYTPGLQGSITRAGAFVATLAVLVAWFAPTVSASGPLYDAFGYARQPWEDLQIEFSRLFGGVQARNQDMVSGFSGSLAPRGSFRLADTIVMYVTSDDPLYWRAVVYERYTGQGWLAPDRVQPFYFEAGDAGLGGSLAEQYLDRAEVRQEFRLAQVRGSFIAAAADVHQLSIPVRADLVTGTWDQPGEIHADISSLRSPTSVRPGLRYTAVSSVSVADAESLRHAGDAYPGWVAPYLGLPGRIPERVGNLAESLTRDSDNAYDKAVAIESFVRRFPYTLDTTPPPRRRDWVDYFLFDLRQGYCDYFASAMAVMLREVGVPARVVSGYATGDLDPQGNRYIVRDSHAHSWVEVFFPRYGWITFEPSGYRTLPPRTDLGTRPSALPATPVAPLPPQSNEPQPDENAVVPPSRSGATATNSWQQNAQSLIFPSAVILGVLLCVAAGIGYFWRRGLRGLTGPELAYARLGQLAAWLGHRQRPTQTPNEYAARLSRLVPEKADSVSRIVEAFVSYRFGNRTTGTEDSGGLHGAWRSLRLNLIRARIFGAREHRSDRA